MLDMGFIHDVKKLIAKLPVKRQSLFFSATMPVAITELAGTILAKPVRVEVTPASSTVDKIEQVVYFIDRGNKNHLLFELLKDNTIERVLVFTRTKHGADKVAKELVRLGITSLAIHGNKSQNNRQNALRSFKSKETRVLVATDIAARGIDIDELTHVINFELPNEPESYVHRIGRTARAGKSGIAIAFCDAEEKAYLKDIQKLIGKQIPVIDDHAFPLLDHNPIKTSRGSFRARPSVPRNSNNRQ
jgi:ATP-dependent RNA helicase RhlE